jgi:hypothetical protein
MREISPFRVMFIGDSHVLKFTSRLFDLCHCQIFTEATYIHGGRATEVIDASNRLSAPLLGRFSSEKIIDPRGLPWNDDTYFPTYSTIKHAEGRPAKPDLIVFFFGDIELRKILKGTLATTIDEVVDKYVRDLAGIRKATTITAYVHTLDPPTQDMDVFEKINGFRMDAATLSASYAAFNSKLTEKCMRYGFSVVSTWPETFDSESSRGCRATFEFDGVHLHPSKGAEATMRVVSRTLLYGRTAEASLPAYTAFAQGAPPISELTVKRMTSVPIETCAELNDPISVDTIRNPEPSPHWGGAPPDSNFPKFNKHIRYGSLSPKALRCLHKVLYETHYKEISDIIGHFVVVNSRYVESEPNPDEGIGPQKLHYDGNPPGIVRGLIYLCDVDNEGGGFEWQAEKGAPTTTIEVGPQGSFLLFDANRVFHRASPPKARTRKAIDLIFLRTKAGTKSVSISALGKTWPVDPRLFTISATDAAVETTPAGIKDVGATMLYLK